MKLYAIHLVSLESRFTRCNRPKVGLISTDDPQQVTCKACLSAKGNPHEYAARQKKAESLTNTLFSYGFSSCQVEAMPEHGWHVTATAAHVTLPSQETRGMVVEMLQRRERAAVIAVQLRDQILRSAPVRTVGSTARAEKSTNP